MNNDDTMNNLRFNALLEAQRLYGTLQAAGIVSHEPGGLATNAKQVVAMAKIFEEYLK